MLAADSCRHGGSCVMRAQLLLCVLLCAFHSCVAKEEMHADTLPVENLRVPVIIAFKVVRARTRPWNFPIISSLGPEISWEISISCGTGIACSGRGLRYAAFTTARYVMFILSGSGEHSSTKCGKCCVWNFVRYQPDYMEKFSVALWKRWDMLMLGWIAGRRVPQDCSRDVLWR